MPIQVQSNGSLCKTIVGSYRNIDITQHRYRAVLGFLGRRQGGIQGGVTGGADFGLVELFGTGGAFAGGHVYGLMVALGTTCAGSGGEVVGMGPRVKHIPMLFPTRVGKGGTALVGEEGVAIMDQGKQFPAAGLESINYAVVTEYRWNAQIILVNFGTSFQR